MDLGPTVASPVHVGDGGVLSREELLFRDGRVFGLDPSPGSDSGPPWATDSDVFANNFSMAQEDRYDCLESELSLLEVEFEYLLSGSRDHRLKVSFGPTYEDRDRFSASGTTESIVETMVETLDNADRFYATVSRSSKYPTNSFRMINQGSASRGVVRTVVRNADAIATELDTRLRSG